MISEPIMLHEVKSVFVFFSKIQRMLRPIKYLNSGINGKNLRTIFTSNFPQLQEINIIEDKLHPNVYNVQMNRPEKLNTFTIEFWRLLLIF